MKRPTNPQSTAAIVLFLLTLAIYPSRSPSQTAAPAAPPIDPAVEYADAVKLASKERFAEAATKLESVIAGSRDPATVSKARFLAGYSRYRAGAWKEAAPHFEGYIKSNGLLTDYARYHRAVSLTRAMDTETAPGAWKLFFANHPASRWEFEARIIYAESLLAAGKPNEASEVLKALLAKTKTSESRARILLVRGRCEEAKNLVSEARSTYRSIYIHHPCGWPSAEAAKRMIALGSSTANLSPDERLIRAEGLYKGARFEESLVEYEALLADKRFAGVGEVYRKALNRRAMCMFRSYHTENALAAFQSFIANEPDGSYTSTACYYTAHCFGRLERYDEALAAYRKVTVKWPTSSLVPNAYANMAQIYTERGLFDDALDSLRTIKSKYAAKAREIDVSWRIGWIEYRRGNFMKAREAFEDHPGGMDLTERRNDYWMARAREKSGDVANAAGEYERIRSAKPYDYYGILAAARIGKPQPEPIANATPEARVVTLGVTNVLLDRARELSQMGLTDFAADEIAKLQATPGLTADDHYAIALLLEQYGNYHKSRKSVYNYMHVNTTTYSAERDKYWRLLYPRAYRQAVTGHAQKFAMDPNLVWSIMMQESNFQTRVVSPAGARGLMQLILPTARSVAKRLGMADYRETDLFDPATNILFGVTYLGDVAAGFGDHPARYYMAVASYNGGPQNVTRWRKARPDLEFDELVEEIPFPETRNYVKRVYGNWAVYQMLYGKGAPNGIAAPVNIKMVVKPN